MRSALMWTLVILGLLAMLASGAAWKFLAPWISAGAIFPVRENFHIAGTIQDLDGTPLDNVTVFIDKQRFSYGSIGSNSSARQRDERIVNGTFDFDIRGWTSVSLTFLSPGRYTEHLSFDATNTQVRPGPLGPVNRTNLRILMQKQGTLTRLSGRLATLSFDSDASGTLIDLAEAAPAQDPLGRYFSLTPMPVPDLLHAAHLPLHGLYLTADLAAPDEIATLEIGAPGTSDYRCYVKRMVLHMTNPADGFLPFTPNPSRPPRRQMTTAPGSGYLSTLAITPDDFPRDKELPTGIHFFFRMDGKFGRGNIDHNSPPGLYGTPGQKRRTGAHLQLWFQPNGSRNLEDDDARP